MANAEINNYIKKRYPRWLDYAEYHTSQAGLKGESVDVLNEVLLSLLNKDEECILNMLHSKKGKYCELDFFILRMIKMNSTSVTAPYLAKNKPIPVDRNVDLMNLDLEDVKEQEIDKSQEFLDNYQTVCKIVDRLDLTKPEKQAFNSLFVMPESMSDYDNRTKKVFYTYYASIRTVVSVILFQEGKVNTHSKIKINKRVKSLVNQYNLTKMY